MNNFENTYDFLRGERYVIKTIPFDKIHEQMEGYPGLYSWYIRPKPNREDEITPVLDALLQQTSLNAKLTGNIRLAYEGRLTKKNEKISVSNYTMLRNIFLMTPYPLYIGMSIDLKSRIATHLNQLHDYSDPYKENFSVSASNLDTDEESQFFASRILNVFEKAQVRSLDCLFVRVYEYRELGKSKSLSYEHRKKVRMELLEAEKVANSMFNPVFGRR